MKNYQTNGIASSVNEKTALPSTRDGFVYQLLLRQILGDLTARQQILNFDGILFGGNPDLEEPAE